jgi:hypothetical protein
MSQSLAVLHPKPLAARSRGAVRRETTNPAPSPLTPSHSEDFRKSAKTSAGLSGQGAEGWDVEK